MTLPQIHVPKYRDREAMDYFMAMYGGGYSGATPMPTSPEIDMRDLSPRMQKMLGEHIQKHLERGPEMNKGLHHPLTENEIYLLALGEFGVTCPHMWRSVWRERDGKQEMVEGERECVDCQCREYRKVESKPQPVYGRLENQVGELIRSIEIPSPPPPDVFLPVENKLSFAITEEPISSIPDLSKKVYRRQCRLTHDTFLYVEQS